MPGSGPSTGSGRTGSGFGANNLRFEMIDLPLTMTNSRSWLQTATHGDQQPFVVTNSCSWRQQPFVVSLSNHPLLYAGLRPFDRLWANGGRGFGAQNLRFVMSNWQIYFSGSADWLLPDRTIDRNCLAAGKEKQDSSKIFENDPFAMSLPKGGLRRPSTSSGRTGCNLQDERGVILRVNRV